MDYQRLLEITRFTRDYQRLQERLLEITRDYWRLLEITIDYQRLLEVELDYVSLSAQNGNYDNFPGHVRLTTSLEHNEMKIYKDQYNQGVSE